MANPTDMVLKSPKPHNRPLNCILCIATRSWKNQWISKSIRSSMNPKSSRSLMTINPYLLAIGEFCIIWFFMWRLIFSVKLALWLMKIFPSRLKRWLFSVCCFFGGGLPWLFLAQTHVWNLLLLISVRLILLCIQMKKSTLLLENYLNLNTKKMPHCWE